jgi:hypothetical protein
MLADLTLFITAGRRNGQRRFDETSLSPGTARKRGKFRQSGARFVGPQIMFPGSYPDA